MPTHQPPQPSPDRITHFLGNSIVVGLQAEQPELVALTAASLARATGAAGLYFGYVDTARVTIEEFGDGTVRHEPINPDIVDDDAWTATRDRLHDQVAATMAGQDVSWHLRYLAGRVDRSLTHLARAVDAAAFVVGTHRGKHRALDFLHRSVGVQLSHRQHRPVLVVPLHVVDWRDRALWE